MVVLVVVARPRAFADACAARKWRIRDFSGHKQRFFFATLQKNAHVFGPITGRSTAQHSAYQVRIGETKVRRKATRNEKKQRPRRRARAPSARRAWAAGRVEVPPRPREPPGRARRGSRAESPDRRRGACGHAARGAQISRTRRCRFNGAAFAARDDRQRLLRRVRVGGAPERRRVHVGRVRGCRGQPSVSGTSSPPNATGRPSVVAPSTAASPLPRWRKRSGGHIWHARRAERVVSVVLLFAT